MQLVCLQWWGMLQLANARLRAHFFTRSEAAGFDLLLTTDKNIRHQQNLTGRKIAVAVLGNQQWPTLRRYVEKVIAAVDAATPGSYTEVEIPFTQTPPPCFTKGRFFDQTARSLFFCRLGRQRGRREGARVDHRQEQHDY